jgi:hypothetical protein
MNKIKCMIMVMILSYGVRLYAESDDEVYLWGSLTTLTLVAVGAVTAEDGEDVHNDWTSSFYYRITEDDKINLLKDDEKEEVVILNKIEE